MLEQIAKAWRSRYVIQYLTIAELRTTYRNTILGYVWTLLDPLLMMGIYVLFVVGVFGRGGPQYPVLLFSALLAWWWFTQSVSASVESISSRGKLIQTINFDKVALPLHKIGVATAKYVFGFVVLIPFLIAYHATPTVTLLYFPLLLLVQLALTVGVCLIVAVLGAYFKDMHSVIRFATRALFFLSPVLYSALDRVPDRFLGVYLLNPFAALFESYKAVLVHGEGPVGEYVLVAAAVAIVFLAAGLWVFGRHEAELAMVV